MPKPKKTNEQIYNEHLRRYSDEYANYELYAKSNQFMMDANEFLQKHNPELHEKYFKALQEYKDTVITDQTGVPTKKNVISLTGLKYHGGDPEKIANFYNVMDEVKEYTDSFLENLSGPEKAFKEFYKMELAQLDISRDNASFANAAFNNTIISSFQLIPGTGPYMSGTVGKDGRRIPTDYAKLEKELRQPDGKGFFVPYMNLCKAVNKMWDIEYQKQKNDFFGWTPEKKKELLEQQRRALSDFSRNFEDLKQTVKKHGNLYKKDVHLNNVSDELTGLGEYSNRDINYLNGQMKGQAKAIELGWDFDELSVLGQIGELGERNEKNIKNNNTDLKRDKESLKKLHVQLKGLQDDLKKIQKDADSNERQYAVDQFKKENNELRKWHKEYEEKLRWKVNHNEDVEAFVEENAERLEEWKDYNRTLGELTLQPQIRALQKEITNKQNDIKRTEADIVSDMEAIENTTMLKSEISRLQNMAYSTKINNLNDKRKVLGEYRNFFKKYGDLNVSKSRTLNENTEINANNKILDDIEAKLTTGINEEITKNDYAKKKVQFDIDIYGPKPKYHEGWEESSVIDKKVFNESFKPYSEEDLKNLPFTDVEMAYINMAGTLFARDGVRADYENTPQNVLDPDELIIKNHSMWMDDMSYLENGPRYNMGSFKNIINEGRQRGLNAMKMYANGQKRPLAEMIQKSLLFEQKNFANMSTLSNAATHHYAKLSTLMGLLEKDPQLNAEFQRVNSLQPKNNRVSYDVLNQMKTTSRLYMESINGTRKLQEFDKTAEKRKELWDVYEGVLGTREAFEMDEAGERKRLEMTARRVDIMNRVQNAASTYQDARPGFLAAQNKIIEDMRALKNPHRATYEQQEFGWNNGEVSEFIKSIGTPEGLKEFDLFADSLNEKYGLTYNPEKNRMEINGRSAEEFPAYQFECEKFLVEREQKVLLNKISSGRLTPKAMTEAITQYMINNHQICDLERGIETGVLSSFSNKGKNYAEANLEKSELFKKQVAEYIPNIDFSGLSEAEIAEQLQIGKYSLDAICADIETNIDNEMFAKDPSKVQNMSFTSLKSGINQLIEENKHKKRFGGTEEYDQIVEDTIKLQEELAKAEATFKESAEHIYDTKKLNEMEDQLIEKMDKYIARKDNEKEAGKTSNTADARREAVMNARKLVMQRRSEELELGDRSEEKLRGAEQTKELMASGVAKRNAAKKASSAEVLQAAMDEEVLQRNRFAAEVNVSNISKLNERTDRIYESVKRTLYYQTLKEALAPNKMDSREQAKIKEKKIFDKVGDGNGLQAADDKKMESIMQTKFGKEYYGEVLNRMLNSDKGLNHGEMIKLRDETLRKMYKRAMDTKNPNRKADVKEVLEVGHSLGSKELSAEYKKYRQAQREAELKKQQQKKLEEKNNEVQGPRK